MSFIKSFNSLIVIAFAFVIASCTINEDPGPIQYNEQPFAVPTSTDWTLAMPCM